MQQRIKDCLMTPTKITHETTSKYKKSIQIKQRTSNRSTTTNVSFPKVVRRNNNRHLFSLVSLSVFVKVNINIRMLATIVSTLIWNPFIIASSTVFHDREYSIINQQQQQNQRKNRNWNRFMNSNNSANSFILDDYINRNNNNNSNTHNTILNNHNKMSKKGSTITNMDNASSSSAMKELKEIIQSQAREIQTLKSLLDQATATNTNIPSSATKSKSTSSNHSHGHHVSSSSDNDTSTYLTSPFYSLAAQRVGWLAFFLLSLSLTAVIMNGFEHTLSKQIELAYFVPLLAGHGGNTGGQTVGTVLSALSTGSINTKQHAWKIIRKEAMTGLTVGFILGSVVAAVAHYAGGISYHVATVVFCTLPLLSTIAATLASSIPFACTLVGLDPAVIAAPCMTTFVDVTGLLSYFLIANQVFKVFGLEL